MRATLRAWLRHWWIYPIGLVVLVLILLTVFSPSDNDIEVPLQVFTAEVAAGRVTSAEVARNDRVIEFRVDGDEQTYETAKEERVPLRQLLLDADVPEEEIDRLRVTYGQRSGGASALAVIVNFLPIILIVGFVIFMVRMATNAQKMRAQMVGLVTNADPVCKQTVNPGSAAGTSTFQGITYQFCSREHKDAFDADPVPYLLQK